MLAPIVLFTYNRVAETKRILDSLAANAEAGESLLYIYCDGAKDGSSEEMLANIGEVRKICLAENRFKDTKVIIQSSNKGLTASITGGVTEIVNKYGRVIVLEDDLFLSPFFLFYMNDSLDRYEHDKKVGSIGACNFFACGRKFPQTFFITLPDCWGWATWKDRWANFESDASVLHMKLKEKNLIHKFNGYGSYNMEQMLLEQIGGKGNSWAIRWTAVSILKDWLSLYPNPSMSHHVESKLATQAFINVTPPLCEQKPELRSVPVKEIPTVVQAMKRGYSGTGDYYGDLKEHNRQSIFKRLYYYIFYNNKLVKRSGY